MNLTKDLIKSNYSTERSKIVEITIHHWAGIVSLKTAWAFMNNAKNKVSSHYVIKDNNAVQFVEENNTAWTNKHWESNKRAVTIEVINETINPYTFSEASYKTLIELVHDIAKRNNLLPLVKGLSLTWHRMYANTNCPSDFLINRMDDIVKQVNALSDTQPEIKDSYFRVRKSWKDGKSQQGAFQNLTNAILRCDDLNNSIIYKVYDSYGNQIYPKIK